MSMVSWFDRFRGVKGLWFYRFRGVSGFMVS